MTVNPRQQLAVGTEPVRLDTAVHVQGSGNGSSIALAGASGTIYLGGEDVTTATGFPLAAATPFSTDLEPGERLWAVGAAGQTVDVLETGV